MVKSGEYVFKLKTKQKTVTIKGQLSRFASSLLQHGCKTPGCKTPGCKNPGCKNPGCKTPGCKNPGCKTPGCKNPWL